jgi:ABC-type sugar transport system ATPase subunit
VLSNGHSYRDRPSGDHATATRGRGRIERFLATLTLGPQRPLEVSATLRGSGRDSKRRFAPARSSQIFGKGLPGDGGLMPDCQYPWQNSVI